MSIEIVVHRLYAATLVSMANDPLTTEKPLSSASIMTMPLLYARRWLERYFVTSSSTAFSSSIRAASASGESDVSSVSGQIMLDQLRDHVFPWASPDGCLYFLMMSWSGERSVLICLASSGTRCTMGMNRKMSLIFLNLPCLIIETRLAASGSLLMSFLS